MAKNFKTYFALVILGALTGCTNIPMDGETPTGVNWWLTAVFFFLWLFFSCPLVSRFIRMMSGDETIDDSDDWENSKTIAGASVYAFPIMYVTSLILGAFFEWYINYIISLAVGFIAGAIIRAKINPLCNRYFHKTKLLWIGQGVLAVLSIILALTN
jgi:hypothetical protein